MVAREAFTTPKEARWKPTKYFAAGNQTYAIYYGTGNKNYTLTKTDLNLVTKKDVLPKRPSETNRSQSVKKYSTYDKTNRTKVEPRRKSDNISSKSYDEPVVHSSYKEPTYNVQYPNGHVYKYPHKYSYGQYAVKEPKKRKFPKPRFILPWPFTLYTRDELRPFPANTFFIFTLSFIVPFIPFGLFDLRIPVGISANYIAENLNG